MDARLACEKSIKAERPRLGALGSFFFLEGEEAFLDTFSAFAIFKSFFLKLGKEVARFMTSI